MSWKASRRDLTADVHVIPVNDMKEHTETRDCWCNPDIRKEEGWVAARVLHNSMDGRELVEKHG